LTIILLSLKLPAEKIVHISKQFRKNCIAHTGSKDDFEGAVLLEQLNCKARCSTYETRLDLIRTWITGKLILIRKQK